MNVQDQAVQALMQGIIPDLNPVNNQLQNVILPNAPAPFLIGNFLFASVHQNIVGSLYFATAGGIHQRIRLVHDHGPSIGRAHVNGEWYFPPTNIAFPRSDATTLQITNWIATGNGGNAVSAIPIAGNKIIEYSDGHIDGAGRHISRGIVELQATLNLTQKDINVIYWTIRGLPNLNHILRQSIAINNLTPALQQP
jgi:hypothetical protein